MPESAALLNAAIRDAILTMRCTIWSRTSGTGPYNNALRTGLACRLDTISMQATATGADRDALAARRVFMWDAAYSLQEQGVQIEVTSPAYYAGMRWNPRPGTSRPAIPPGFDGPIAIEIDVTRAS